MTLGLKRKLYHIVKEHGPLTVQSATSLYYEIVGRRSTEGSVYNVLKRLANDGSLLTMLGPVIHKKGGRRRRYYQAIL